MTFKEYVTIKKPIGSTAYVRSLVNRFKLDENSDLNNLIGIKGFGKRSRSAINKLQIKYKKRKEGVKNG